MRLMEQEMQEHVLQLMVYKWRYLWAVCLHLCVCLYQFTVEHAHSANKK